MIQTRGQQLTLLGGIFIIIGVLLPWGVLIDIDRFSITPFRGVDDTAGLVAAVIGTWLLISSIIHPGRAGTRYSIRNIILAVLTSLLCLWSVLDAGDMSIALSEIGAGLYLCLIGAAITLAGGLQRIPDDQP